MRVLVGLTTLNGSIERYAERFDLLELRAEPERLPANKALKRLRFSAPKLGFSLLLPPRITDAALTTPDLLAPALEAANALEASWIILQTGPAVGPSRRARSGLAALAERLTTDARRVGWEPHGPWEEDVAREDADALNIVLVQDLSVAAGAAEPLVYTRLRNPGPGAQLRTSALEHLAEELAETETAHVIVEGRPSQRTRARIQRTLTGTLSALDEFDADDAEDAEDAEDADLDDEEDGA